jgi:hypothetical protein
MQLFIFLAPLPLHVSAPCKKKYNTIQRNTKEIPTTEKARIIHSKTSNMAAA